jgi:cytochrome c
LNKIYHTLKIETFRKVDVFFILTHYVLNKKSKEEFMGTFSRVFCVGVIIADLGAIVYLGGNLITTGELFPSHEETVKHAVVAENISNEPIIKIAKIDPMENFIPDVNRGKKVSGKCKACHTFTNGGKNSTGPNLWNVVGKTAADTNGFSYSSAFKEKSNMVWTEENLDLFLKKPRKFIEGTKMAFGGVKKPEDRANLIEWLKTLK